MAMRWSLALWLAFVCAGVPQAHAQQQGSNPPPAFDIQTNYPSPFAGAVLGVDVAEVQTHLATRTALYLDWSHRPLRAAIGSIGALLGDFVASRLDARLGASISLFGYGSLGLSVPVVLLQQGINTDIVRLAAGIDELAPTALGDIVMSAKGRVLTQTGPWPGIAMALDVIVPTGNEQAFAGEAAPAFRIATTLSRSVGRDLLSLNLGARLRTEPMQAIALSVRHEFDYALAYSHTLGQGLRESPWAVLASLRGRTPAAAPLGIGSVERELARNPLEARLGARRRFSVFRGFMDITGSVGVGLTPGYGSPLPRVVLSVDFLSSDPAGDADGDGFPNAVDGCPQQAETVDGYKDEDGCPDPDNDADEIPDVDDECPLEPEDFDFQEDYDGCPEADPKDSDGDGIFDSEDTCPQQKEDFDQWNDDDGCPDLDNDADGLKDLNDVCPDQRETQNGFRDDDGCPDTRKGRR